MSNVKQDVTTSKPLNEYEVLKGKATQLGIKDAHKIKKETLREMVAAAELKATEMPNGELKMPPGRPVNPLSARQQRLADLAQRRAQPDFKLGRPAQTDSERQQKLAARQVKIDAYNAQQAEIAKGTIIAPEALLPNPNEKLGRPIDLNSPRQIALREYEAKKKAGLIKKGRPSFESLGIAPKPKQNVITHTVTADPVTTPASVDLVPAE